MDSAALWQRYQDWLYFDADLDFFLDISRLRFDDFFVKAMQSKFEAAFTQMNALEGGAIANPDENRMVGHYWLRDADLAPTPELKASIVSTLERIEDFVGKVHSGEISPPGQERFTDILSIGIGGSALGPQFVAQALAPQDAPLALHFVDNSDPAGIDRTLSELGDRLASTLVLVISKSGGTPETRNGMLEAQAAFQAKALNFGAQAVAITGIGSKLEARAHDEGWLTTFPMHDWVGGRTSELSAVGLVAAALQKVDIRGLLAGAKHMDGLTRVANLHNNPAAMLALAWYFAGNGKGTKDMVILPYKDSLALFSRYLQQLVMESLGKETDLDGKAVYQGIAVYGNKGSTDQHAYVQQLREGVPNFFATLIEVLRDRSGPSVELDPGTTAGDYLSGFLQGTRQALYENQRDSITITIGEVNARTVGALIALYERAVGLYATLINVNAYHQPGVEAGKKAAASVLALQAAAVGYLQSTPGSHNVSAIAQAIDQPDATESLYKILRHLAYNDRGLQFSGSWGDPSSLTVQWVAG